MLRGRMTTLDYQRGDDARPEKLKRLRMKLFGPSRDDVWRALAEEIGARFDKGSFWRGAKVVADVPPWQVVLDTYTVSSGDSSVTYTRMRAPYVNADGSRFTVYRKSIFTALGKMLGMQDVEVGYPRFDDDFVIQGNDERKLRQLFSNERLRALIEAQPSIRFTVKDDEGFFRQVFPAGVDKLEFTVTGIIRDIDRLKLLYDLFAETLHTLCHIGSAYEDDPGIVLDR
jgi:hypothetical protein